MRSPTRLCRLDAVKTRPDLTYWWLAGLWRPSGDTHAFSLGMVDYELSQGVMATVDFAVGQVLDASCERVIHRFPPSLSHEVRHFALVLERHGEVALPYLWLEERDPILCPARLLPEDGWVCPVIESARRGLMAWEAGHGSLHCVGVVRRVLGELGFDSSCLVGRRTLETG